jgi:hypothetical protein
VQHYSKVSRNTSADFTDVAAKHITCTFSWEIDSFLDFGVGQKVSSGTIRPKNAVGMLSSKVDALLRFTSAIRIARVFREDTNFTCQSFWARGCLVSTGGEYEKAIPE